MEADVVARMEDLAQRVDRLERVSARLLKRMEEMIGLLSDALTRQEITPRSSMHETAEHKMATRLHNWRSLASEALQQVESLRRELLTALETDGLEERQEKPS